MNAELLLLSYAGILLHYLFQWKDAVKENVALVLTSKSLIKELPSLLLSIVSSSVIVYVREDIANIFVVTPVGAVIAGYAGQSILNKILGAKMPTQTADTTKSKS